MDTEKVTLFPLENFLLKSADILRGKSKRTENLKTLDGFLSGLGYLGQIRSLKTAFMHDLLTGKKRITALLNDTEEQAYE